MIDWPEIKGLLALPPRDRPNVIALYADVVAEIVAEVDALKAENERLKTEAALRIAARVLDESAFTNIYDILKDLTFTHTDETGDVSVVGIGHAAEAILAYLKGEPPCL